MTSPHPPLLESRGPGKEGRGSIPVFPQPWSKQKYWDEGKHQRQVESFSLCCKGACCKPETLARTAQTTAALTRLKAVWIDKSISLSFKIRLMRFLVKSTFLMLVNHGPSQQSSKEE